MSQKERDQFTREAAAYTKEVTASVEASKEFLIAVGVITPSGKVRKKDKPVCIPRVPA